MLQGQSVLCHYQLHHEVLYPAQVALLLVAAACQQLAAGCAALSAGQSVQQALWVLKPAAAVQLMAELHCHLLYLAGIEPGLGSCLMCCQPAHAQLLSAKRQSLSSPMLQECVPDQERAEIMWQLHPLASSA